MLTKQFANKLVLLRKKSKLSLQDHLSKTSKTNIHAIFMPSFPFNLTKKHSYEVDTDSLILSQQRSDQGGVPHEDILETGQHMLLAHQLGVYEERYSVANKS